MGCAVSGGGGAAPADDKGGGGKGNKGKERAPERKGDTAAKYDVGPAGETRTANGPPVQASHGESPPPPAPPGPTTDPPPADGKAADAPPAGADPAEPAPQPAAADADPPPAAAPPPAAPPPAADAAAPDPRPTSPLQMMQQGDGVSLMLPGFDTVECDMRIGRAKGTDDDRDAMQRVRPGGGGDNDKSTRPEAARPTGPGGRKPRCGLMLDRQILQADAWPVLCTAAWDRTVAGLAAAKNPHSDGALPISHGMMHAVRGCVNKHCWPAVEAALEGGTVDRGSIDKAVDAAALSLSDLLEQLCTDAADTRDGDSPTASRARPPPIDPVPRFAEAYHHVEQGDRPYMEDIVIRVPDPQPLYAPPAGDYFVGLFDGHAGVEAAEWARERLCHSVVAHPLYPSDRAAALREGVCACDAAFAAEAAKFGVDAGACAVACVLTPAAVPRRGAASARELHCASLGDARAVLCSTKGDGDMTLTPLTTPHTVDSSEEREAVEKRGGQLLWNGGCLRVNGQLQITRSIGDRPARAALSQVPDLKSVPIGERDEFVVLGSDGLYEVMPADDICDFIRMSKMAVDGLLDAQRALVKYWGRVQREAVRHGRPPPTLPCKPQATVSPQGSPMGSPSSPAALVPIGGRMATGSGRQSPTNRSATNISGGGGDSPRQSPRLLSADAGTQRNLKGSQCVSQPMLVMASGGAGGMSATQLSPTGGSSKLLLPGRTQPAPLQTRQQSFQEPGLSSPAWSFFGGPVAAKQALLDDTALPPRERALRRLQRVMEAQDGLKERITALQRTLIGEKSVRPDKSQRGDGPTEKSVRGRRKSSKAAKEAAEGEKMSRQPTDPLNQSLGVPERQRRNRASLSIPFHDKEGQLMTFGDRASRKSLDGEVICETEAGSDVEEELCEAMEEAVLSPDAIAVEDYQVIAQGLVGELFGKKLKGRDNTSVVILFLQPNTLNESERRGLAQLRAAAAQAAANAAAGDSDEATPSGCDNQQPVPTLVTS